MAVPTCICSCQIEFRTRGSACLLAAVASGGEGGRGREGGGGAALDASGLADVGWLHVSRRMQLTQRSDRLGVIFSVALSTNDNSAVYHWDFADAQRTTTPDGRVIHQYRQAGVYAVRVRVEVAGHTIVSDVLAAHIGHPPEAVILSPREGARFTAGQTFALEAADGSSDQAGEVVSYDWEVQMRHDNHMQ